MKTVQKIKTRPVLLQLKPANINLEDLSLANLMSQMGKVKATSHTIERTISVRAGAKHVRTLNRQADAGKRVLIPQILVKDITKLGTPESKAKFVDMKEREMHEMFTVLRAEHGLSTKNQATLVSPKKTKKLSRIGLHEYVLNDAQSALAEVQSA
jgi:hypothetical protein